MSPADSNRQESQPAFVLHTRAFRETSLLVEAFTQDFGRKGFVARGARRPKSALRGLVLPFQPLLVSWTGKGELPTLTKAEWLGGQPSIAGLGLVCGFYLNELLIRLLPREDPHQALFRDYQEALAGLSSGGGYGPVLRRFELRLLKELGYAPVLERDTVSGAPIDPQRHYTYEIERGPVPAGSQPREGCQVLGKTLLDMAAESYQDPVTLQQAKLLMRMLINYHLGGQPLHTRQLLKDMQQL